MWQSFWPTYLKVHIKIIQYLSWDHKIEAKTDAGSIAWFLKIFIEYAIVWWLLWNILFETII